MLNDRSIKEWFMECEDDLYELRKEGWMCKVSIRWNREYEISGLSKGKYD